MYGSSLHVEVFCLAQPGSVNLSLDFATSLARSSFARCAVVMLGLQTDSPSQRQPRLANAEASTGDTLASPHGSSSEVRRGQELLSNLAIDSGRPMRSPSLAPNMERRGVAAPPDGFPASTRMPHGNVRSDGLPDVSQEREETRQQLPDEDLRQLLRLARVPQWADHIVGLGAVCVQDVAMTSAKDLAPMPILAAQRLIRFAGEALTIGDLYRLS